MPMDINVKLGSNTFEAKGVTEPVNEFFVDLFKSWVNAQGDGSQEVVELAEDLKDENDALRAASAAADVANP